MRTLYTALLMLALAGCVNPKVRPFAEVELIDHTDDQSRSRIAAGVSFVSENGMVFDVAPVAQFDFGGGGVIRDPQAGAFFRLRYVK